MPLLSFLATGQISFMHCYHISLPRYQNSSVTETSALTMETMGKNLENQNCPGKWRAGGGSTHAGRGTSAAGGEGPRAHKSGGSRREALAGTGGLAPRAPE